MMSLGALNIGGLANNAYERLCDIANSVKIPRAVTDYNGVAGSGTGKHVFSLVTRRIDFFAYDNNYWVQILDDAGQPSGGPFEIIAPGYYSFPMASAGVQISDPDALTGRYTILVWA